MKMNRTLIALALCTLLMSTTFGQKNKPSLCPSDITNVSVTFANADGDLFRSDDTEPGVSTPYVTSKSRGEQITAMFQRSNCSYDLTLNLNFSRRRMKLELGGIIFDAVFFNADRVASVPETRADNPAFVAFCGGALPTDPAVPTGVNVVQNANGTYLYDNYAGCGVDADGKYYVRRTLGIDTGADNLGFRFQNSPLDGISTLAAGTSYIRVYHPSANVWELSPEVIPPPGQTNGSLGALLDRSNNTFGGYFSVPFKITVIASN